MASGVKTLKPDRMIEIGGFIGSRFRANLDGRIKNRGMVEHFIELYERGDYDSWFWMGEQIGKWLDAAAYSAVAAHDDSLANKVHEILGRLKLCQQEDGWLSISRNANPVRGMQLYEWYYVLHGLIACYELLNSPVALKIAVRLAEYITRLWGVEPGQFPLAGRFPGNGHGGGEGTLILEPVVLVGKLAGDERLINWGERTVSKWDEWFDRFPESTHTCGYTAMKRIAAGEIDVFEAREPIHAHTFHMTLLGLAALYDATGKTEYRDTVLGCVDHIADEWVFLTGGMSSNERYVPRRFHNARNTVEVCPLHTWLLLLEKALEWTGEARYPAEMERTLFNSLLAAQLTDGSNWSYLTPMNGMAQNPGSPNCCNAAGMRIAARMPTFLYGTTETGVAILIYSGSTIRFNAPDGTPVLISQSTEYPQNGGVDLTVEPEKPSRFELRLRIPDHAGSIDVAVNGERTRQTSADGYVCIDRKWSHKERVRINVPVSVKTSASAKRIAISRGPLVYAYFQDAQDDPTIYHKRRGLFPEDVELLIDPSEPERHLETAEAPENLLGPGLRCEARIHRSPVFHAKRANIELGAYDVERRQVLLLPFVNQGGIRGPYRVFMDYTVSNK